MSPTSTGHEAALRDFTVGNPERDDRLISWQIVVPVRLLSEIGTPGALRPDRGDGWRMFNLAPLLPEGENYSRIYRGRRELIDHIFVTRALVEKVESVASLVEGGLPSITDDPGETPHTAASDHAAVVATLDV
jgi:hypothetical protein